MPAGRPKKYHTKEEKDEAHRRAVARYYYRNLEAISAERKIKRDAKRELHSSTAAPQTISQEPQRIVAIVQDDSRVPVSLIEQCQKVGNPAAVRQAIEPETASDSILAEPEPATGRVEILERRLANFLKGRTEKELLTSMCTEFVNRLEVDVLKALDSFLDPVAELTTIVEGLADYGATSTGIKSGTGGEKGVELHGRAAALLRVIEELCSEAILGPEALAVDFRQSNLAFQNT